MTEAATGRGAARWITVVSWTAIVAVVVWIAVAPGPDIGRAVELLDAEIGARTGLALRALGDDDDRPVRREILRLDAGDAGMRQRAAVLAGEVWAVEHAASRVAWAATLAAEAGGETARVQEVLASLYPASPPAGETQAARVARLTADDRALLLRNLGWYGRLATSPEGGDPSARAALIASGHRTLAALGTIVAFLVLGGLAGAALLLLGLVLALLGRLRLSHEVEPGRESHGALTFALWLVGVEVFFRFAARGLALQGAAARLGMFAVEIATLGVLAVGVLRGVGWTDLRRRIGWHRGAGFLREAGAGLLGTLVDAALTGSGLLVWWVASTAAGHQRAPGEGAHPIVVELVRGAAPDAAVIVLLGAVAAPLVEETMFRGVLYGHLREATARWPRVLTVGASALVSSVVFASLHPQGWTAVPALTGSGIALALVREWRGSLIAPMVAHAVWNGSLMVLVRVALAP